MQNITKHLTGVLKVSSLILPLCAMPAAAVFAIDGTSNSKEAAVKAPAFPPRKNAMADVDAMLAKASAKGKLGLIVMGGNWCHDSNALARRMSSPKLAPILDANYESMLVDVAGLSDNMDIAKRFGRPVIYGTPTVLIIDPATKQLVNAHDMHQWRDAESISLEDTTAYFTKMVTAETREAPADDQLAPHYAAMMAEIDTFEKVQAGRIYNAFSIVGPMVMMKNKERPENFRDLWVELSKFRYQITKDLSSLKAEVRKFAAQDGHAELTFPSYEPFSWEK